MKENRKGKIALKKSIHTFTSASVAIPVGAPNADAARAFLKELKTPLSQTAFKEAGLEPVKDH
jgi:ABC-type molybdate transport system substrate-binding protein